MADKLVSVNDDYDFPAPVREKHAAHLGNAGTPEGKAVEATARPIAEAAVTRPFRPRPAKPLVVFTFDDGWVRDLTVVKPILDEKGIKATFCVIAGKVGADATRSNWAQVHQLQDEGHEIVNHSLTHASLGDSEEPALIDAEMKQSQDIFLANGFRPTGFCWVGQRSTGAARRTARKLFSYALGGTGSRKQPLGTYEIPRETLNSNSDVARLKRIVDNAKTNNELIVFLTHPDTTELNELGIANLREMIDYVKSVGVEITTAGEALNQVGNLLDTEGTVIDGSGRLFEVKDATVAEVGRTVWGGYNLKAALAPQDYAEGAITHSTTTNALNTDWPETGIGNMITNRVNSTNYAFSFQEFFATSGARYTRRGASLTKWGPWVNTAGTHTVGAGSATHADNAPSTYGTGTTLQPVVSPATASTPTGGPGLLITHRAAARYCVQEFQADNGGGLYRRTVSSTDAWLPWKQVTLT